MESIYDKSTKGPILYIRHAPTAYNTSTQPKCLLQNMPCYIDCPINKDSNDIIEKASLVLNDLNVKYIFTSPMLRCLETTYEILKHHPDKDKFKVYVHPYITEGINSIHDYCINIKAKKEKFNEWSEIKYDWSIFDKMYLTEEERESFFLNFIEIDDDIILQEICQRIKKEKSDELIAMLTCNIKSVKKRIETLESIKLRSNKFKSDLKEFLKKNSFDFNGDEKVIVVTHSALIRISTSLIANREDELVSYPEDCYEPENCEIITISI
jgi:broad specificity phosphatase PhoE